MQNNFKTHLVKAIAQNNVMNQHLNALCLVFYLLSKSAQEHTKIALTSEKKMIANNSTLDKLNRQERDIPEVTIDEGLARSIQSATDTKAIQQNAAQLTELQIKIQKSDAKRQGVQNTIVSERQSGQIEATRQNTTAQESAQAQQAATACSKENLSIVQSFSR